MILSHQASQYGHLDTLNSKIHPLFQILDTDPGWCNNSGIVACKNSRAAAGGGGWRGGGVAGVHLACRMGYAKIVSNYTFMLKNWQNLPNNNAVKWDSMGQNRILMILWFQMNHICVWKAWVTNLFDTHFKPDSPSCHWQLLSGQIDPNIFSIENLVLEL